MTQAPEEEQHIRIIDLHQDMLSGVAKLDGGFSAYSPTYLHGPARASTIWSSMYPDASETSLVTQLEAHSALLASHSDHLRLVTTVADMDSLDPRTGVLPHSEGLSLPSTAPDALQDLWANHSLRSLGLTWNYETDYGISCYGERMAPLKSAGRALVAALAESPILLDLAHLNDGGYFDALDAYEPPVLVTHSFCRALNDHPRGLSDEQLRALGAHGGLVGVAFDPDFLGQGSIDEAMRHIDRIASLAGEDSVSIGSDWGVASMGTLAGAESLSRLLDTVNGYHGAVLAEKFAFANAHDFLRAQLPLSV